MSNEERAQPGAPEGPQPKKADSDGPLVRRFARTNRGRWDGSIQSLVVPYELYGIGPAGDISVAQDAQYVNQVDELSRQVERLAGHIERGSKVEASEIKELRQRVEQVATAGQQLTAPILLPSREAMTVRLVSIGELERLEEYHADESRAFAFFGIAAGAALGMLVNLAAAVPEAPPPGRLYWLLFGLLCLVSGVYLCHAHTVRSRAKRLRQEVEAPPSHRAT